MYCDGTTRAKCASNCTHHPWRPRRVRFLRPVRKNSDVEWEGTTKRASSTHMPVYGELSHRWHVMTDALRGHQSASVQLADALNVGGRIFKDASAPRASSFLRRLQKRAPLPRLASHSGIPTLVGSHRTLLLPLRRFVVAERLELAKWTELRPSGHRGLRVGRTASRHTTLQPDHWPATITAQAFICAVSARVSLQKPGGKHTTRLQRKAKPGLTSSESKRTAIVTFGDFCQAPAVRLDKWVLRSPTLHTQQVDVCTLQIFVRVFSG